ncbi:YbbR-like domain-containing protein [Psychroflexus sediminis]|uniref:YbbR-like protein n=1 Tax=Psychroflexus sediminis TaxID=470826 RepID=A0A1G7VPS9_9FLAO|nr:hypothetical protein [Psychroflexus sediminis]SDG61812.1 hypothetical protein SAMN04488027_10454 [Psychroflexus sediminis]
MNKYKQIEKIKTGLQKRNYKAFFFFLGFTLLIWIFVQMSKTYEHDVQLTFKLEGIPQHIVFENKSKNISAQVKHTGFKILSITLFNSSIDLNFNQLDSLGNYYSYSLQNNKTQIAKSLNLSKEVLEIAKEKLQFSHYKLSTKKLKIKPNIQVNFNKGYDSVSDFRFEPAFIEVSGNDSILNTLEFISTKKKVLKGVSDTLHGQIEIQKIDSVSIKYLEETVDYTLPVVKFTEGTFEIPIHFENPSLENELVIFPKTVKVNFTTSLSNYERIDESGFKVIAKYEPNEDFMFLELVKQPKLVKHVSLENYKVDYLIKK